MREQHPAYYNTYRRLNKPEEKADFFRYLVVYGEGGVYADVDTVCVRPMDDLCLPSDNLVGPLRGELKHCRVCMMN